MPSNYIQSSEEDVEKQMESEKKTVRKSARIHSQKRKASYGASNCNGQTENAHVKTIHDNSNIELDSNATCLHINDILKSLQQLKANTLTLHSLVDMKVEGTDGEVSKSYAHFINNSKDALASIVQEFELLEESGRRVVGNFEPQGSSADDIQTENSAPDEKNFTPLKQCKEENQSTSSRSSKRLQDKYVTRSQKKLPRRENLFKEIDAQAPSGDHPVQWKAFKRRNANNFVYGSNNYNSEKYGEYGADNYSSEDSFIDDGIDELERQPHHKKKRRNTKESRKKSKVVASDEEEDENSVGDIEPCDDVKIESESDLSHEKDEESRPCGTDDLMLNNGKIRARTNSNCVRNTRVSRAKERNRSKLKRLQKLRSSKNLPLKQREKILESDTSDDEDKSSTLLQESEDDFIDDDGIQSEQSGHEKSGDEHQQVANDTQKTSHLKRVVISDSSDENDNDDNKAVNPILTETERYFFEAVGSDDVGAVECLLKCENIANHFNENKDTALHISVRNSSHKMLNMLLEYGANPNIDSLATHAPPLTEAALRKDPLCFKILLSVSDIRVYSKNLQASDGKNLLHLLVTIPESEVPSDSDNLQNVRECMDILKQLHEKSFVKFLFENDEEKHYPLMTAIKQNCVQGVSYLMYEMVESGREDCFDYETSEGGTLLHFAVQYSVECLNEVLKYLSPRVDDTDFNSWTPLMYAAELGKGDCLQALYEAGSSIHIQVDGITPLHLAAAKGDLDTIRFLLQTGHSVRITDKCGWPPLLYANFQSDKNCAVALFEKDPSQLFCLSRLIDDESDDMKDKNKKMIQMALQSISDIDAYYTTFNDFIAENLSLLDDNNLGVFVTAWKRILSFENKVKWLRKRNNVTYHKDVVVDRSCVLKSTMKCLMGQFSISEMNVRFQREAGSCLGPKREFLNCLMKDATDKQHQLFTPTGNNEFRPIPNTYFFNKMQTNHQQPPTTTESSVHQRNSQKHNSEKRYAGVLKELNLPDEKLILDDDLLPDDELEACIDLEHKSNKDKLKNIYQQLRFLGRFVARVVLASEDIAFQFTNSFLKKILHIPLEHPQCLCEEDYGYYSKIKENDVDELEVSFSAPCMNPWTDRYEEIPLDVDNPNKLVTERNKDEFLRSLSSFLYEKVAERETSEFRSGFYQCILMKDINIFTADEFGLLLNGVSKIDVEDWKRNTKYKDWSATNETIKWFWRLVTSLKEGEKALLLKFATGSPCVPIGGFSKLRGLGSKSELFSISRYRGMKDKLPGAATCFNHLRLPEYSNEEMLRDKVLIAIRHGCEGFEFS